MFGGMGTAEMLIIGVIALLLFGKRLPEVARNLGKSFTEFKRGMTNVQDEIRDTVHSEPAASTSRPVQHDDGDDDEELTAPKFEPPVAAAPTPVSTGDEGSSETEPA